ncbi:PGF-CTERM sorting domain-containing protein [Geoglobus acetivorans]|uniref:PGF-CTERM archaeal protein-sorting signal domain-containing protein n=1 Tax=Geoglobus acetivorans TaxID=565033 RepID=A0A0A7GDV1_GEOAI|nr:hypothetical protein GACE_0982 [Geoglobus acetivorans]
MNPKNHILGLLFALLLVAIQPAHALGVLKIEAPSSASVGEEVEIRVVETLSGDPVEGVTVYVNGAEIGVTDENGVVDYVFDSPGVYVIGATKFGYTPALDISISVEDVSTPVITPTESPTQEPTPETEIYRGLVFKRNILSEVFEYTLSQLEENSEIPDLIEEALDKKPIEPLAFFTDGRHYMILYGDLNLKKSGYYEIEGYSLDATVEFEGMVWTMFEVTEIRELTPEAVDVSDLVANPSSYAGKEIVVNGPFREVAFEIESFGKPVCIGSISTLPVDFGQFAERIKEFGEELIKEPDRETVEEITKFSGVSTFRFEENISGVGSSTQAYWKAVNAEITALTIPASLVKVIFPDELGEFISERGIVLLIERVDIPAERVALSDLTANPGYYNGRVVEIQDIYSAATDISIKDTLAAVFPPAAGSPVDAYFEPMAIFNLPPDSAIIGFGTTGFQQNYGSVDKRVSVDAKYTLKGVVISANAIDERLPSVPALVVFERYRGSIENDLTIPSDQAEEVVKTFNLIKNVATELKGEESKTPELHETPEPHESPEPHETPEPSGTPTPAPSETPAPLQALTLEISPDSITANPGDTINLRLRVDWEPKDWRGKADVKIVLSAAGFKKEYELPDVILENPPIEEEFSYTLPADIPPLTYEAKVIVEAGGQKAEDGVQIKVGVSETPGFEVVLGLAGLVGAVGLRRWMR